MAMHSATVCLTGRVPLAKLVGTLPALPPPEFAPMKPLRFLAFLFLGPGLLLPLACAAVCAAEASVPEPSRPLSPQDTPAKMTLPEGFVATLFAGEPDLVQPMSMSLDDRGRMWVVENFSYPGWKSEGKDRVLIFEDQDGDGHFDSRKVFLDNGVNLTSVAVGFGGVWLTSLPNLIFVPDANGDDVPDGPATVLLDGWNIEKAGHNAVNDLIWGPDGWLYGCNGIQSKSNLGKPGTPDGQRTPIDCGVWRYHPTRRVFEAVSYGTTNPWGIDFDEFGQIFITNCVIAHLWHAIPGGHMVRMYGQDLNPYVYGLLQSCSDHLHWAGGHWTESRGNKPEHSVAGGGHAHVGCLVYQGDNWPASYRNHVFMVNLHGNRVNQDILERRGSGYVAHHGPDLLTVADTWFRGLTLLTGPDGGVYVSDWTDTGECHDHKIEETDQTNGRIYKITYGRPAHKPVDLATLDDQALIKLLQHKNAWYARHASRILQERAAARKLAAGTRPALKKLLEQNLETADQLRVVWALHVTGGLDDDSQDKLLNSKLRYVRGWAIQLELEDRSISKDRLAKLASMAREDDSPVVRLFLASALQRLPVDERWPIAAGLLAHSEDASDMNLPLMYWYGFEPLVAADPSRALQLAADSPLPIVRRYAARRATVLDSDGKSAGLDAVMRLLTGLSDTRRQLDVIAGMQEALNGRRHVAMPASWPEVYPKLVAASDETIRRTARRLAVLFGDGAVIAEARRLVTDRSATADDRREAIEGLLQVKDGQLPRLLFATLDDRPFAGQAVRALATYDDPATPAKILEHFQGLSDDDRRDAVSTLASRTSYARELLAAIESGRVPRTELAVYHVRQLEALKDPAITVQLNKVWGSVRPTAADKAALVARYKADLMPSALAAAKAGRGREVFAKNCAACHTLFGAGGKIGPDLTGSQRTNLDYVLSNVIDPSAIVAGDYQVTLVQTTDGRVVTGMVKLEDEQSLTLQTATDTVVLPKDEIENRKKTVTSMMPEGLFGKLTTEQIRDLVAYLGSREQVPLEDK
jgi:putative membrane-bound dehydrogenase-like protein